MKLKRHRTSFHSLTIEAVPAHFQNIYLAAQAITTTTINRIKDEDYKNDISCSTNTELEVTFITEKCGKHDARLISAIENHDMGEVRRICSMSPEVRYSMKRLKTARKHETSERYVKYT